METDVLRKPRARPTPGPHRPTTAVPGNPGPHAGHQEGHRYIYIHRPEKEGAFAGVRIRLHYLRLRLLRLPRHDGVAGRRHDTTAYHTNGWKTTHLMSNNTYTHMQDNNIGGRRLCGRISRLVCARLCRPHAAFSATLRASIAAPGPGPGLSLSRTRAPFRRSR